VPSPPKPRHRGLIAVLCALLVITAIAAGGIWAAYRYLRANADALLRNRVVASLQARFNSPVTLDYLHIEMRDGLHVTGRGLKILYLAGPGRPDADPTDPPPMVSIDTFEFQTDFKALLEPTTRIFTVFVRGMQLDIPPHPHIPPPPDDPRLKRQPKISFVVDKIVCVDSRIALESSTPGKLPLNFNIASLTLTDVGTKKPMLFDAALSNPKPVGDVHATGHFGPWQADNPRDTLLDGDYAFTNADLSSIKGLGGILSSTGHFDGKMGAIAVAGHTDTPDFHIDLSAHPMPMQTDFRVQVNGLTGDLVLQQIDVNLAHSMLHCSGSLTRVGTPKTGVTGHDTELTMTIGPADHGRIEDMLLFALKTNPPILRGSLVTRQRVSLPPGNASVSKRVHIVGSFTVGDAVFASPSFQRKVDEISMRAQGKPKLANARDASLATSTLTGEFVQANNQVDVSNLRYAMPGANAQLKGRYSLDGQKFDFKGTIRMDATVSQLTTGWKSKLLRPFDGLLRRNGAGVELPITISGTRSDPKFNLDMKKMF
jgi:hypothetical protein